MFYNKKWVFFVSAYSLIVCLAFLAYNQYMLSGLLQNFLRATLTTYIAVILTSFLLSLILSLIVWYVQYFNAKIKHKKIKTFPKKVMWYSFTIISYTIVFIIYVFLAKK